MIRAVPDKTGAIKDRPDSEGRGLQGHRRTHRQEQHRQGHVRVELRLLRLRPAPPPRGPRLMLGLPGADGVEQRPRRVVQLRAVERVERGLVPGVRVPVQCQLGLARAAAELLADVPHVALRDEGPARGLHKADLEQARLGGVGAGVRAGAVHGPVEGRHQVLPHGRQPHHPRVEVEVHQVLVAGEEGHQGSVPLLSTAGGVRLEIPGPLGGRRVAWAHNWTAVGVQPTAVGR